MRRLVHNLAVLSRATAAKDRELGTVVEAGATTLRAIAGQDAALRDSIAQLPGTLSAARSTLGNATTLANERGPDRCRALDPAARRLPGALRDVDPLLKITEPLVRTKLRPLVKAAGPVIDDLSPAITNLTRLSPHLKTAFAVFDYVANELAYNPPGAEEGYLFWLAWFAHNANSALSTAGRPRLGDPRPRARLLLERHVPAGAGAAAPGDHRGGAGMSVRRGP